MTRRVAGLLLIPTAALVIALAIALVVHPSVSGASCPRSIWMSASDPRLVIIDGSESWACYSAAKDAGRTLINVVATVWGVATIGGYFWLRSSDHREPVTQRSS